MIYEIIFVSIIGTFLHFGYEISKHNKYVALFAAVNESTWEHIKIALTPTFIYSIVDLFVSYSNPNFFLAKFLSYVSIIIVIPVLFYSYTFFTKKAILFVDIICFYITIIISQLVYNYALELELSTDICNKLGILGIFIIFGFYMVATMLPLENIIFKDPETNKFGINGHSEHSQKK